MIEQKKSVVMSYKLLSQFMDNICWYFRTRHVKTKHCRKSSSLTYLAWPYSHCGISFVPVANIKKYKVCSYASFTFSDNGPTEPLRSLTQTWHFQRNEINIKKGRRTFPFSMWLLYFLMAQIVNLVMPWHGYLFRTELCGIKVDCGQGHGGTSCSSGSCRFSC